MTKAQIIRETRYRAQLKFCGFRSWKRANQRRNDLIDAEIVTDVKSEELKQLQKLCNLYVAWKTSGSTEKELRQLRKMMQWASNHRTF